MNKDVATTDQQPLSSSVAGNVIEQGGAMRQVKTAFTTAVAVQKPRDKDEVLEQCLKEATLAGDEFYYAWTIKTKAGPRLVEGPSVNLALATVRMWGNSAVMINVEESKESYLFTATFIDLETGFNLQRAFRQKKRKGAFGKYDPDREEDIVFQIGQSKAIRNVVANALPSWLINKTLKAAKENVIKRIEEKGIVPARKDTLDFFAKYNITQDRIESKVGKKADTWNAEDLARLHGAVKALLDGTEEANELFPPLEKQYDIPSDKMAEIDKLFEHLKYNKAERSLALGSCEGDPKKIDALVKELTAKVGTGTVSDSPPPEEESLLSHPLSPEERADLIKEILEKGKAHRDISPAKLAKKSDDDLQATLETLKATEG